MNWALPDIAPALSASTPARILAGRAGTRPTTAQLLRFQVDHACARDAVRTVVDHEFPSRMDCVLEVHSAARDKHEYLLDPGAGRKLRSGEDERLRAHLPAAPQVLVAIGDGLSSAAVEAQVPLLLPALLDCLGACGFDSIAGPVYVHMARVGILDALGPGVRGSRDFRPLATAFEPHRGAISQSVPIGTRGPGGRPHQTRMPHSVFHGIS